MTYTFDGWDTPQNSLMHFRTKGSKNGVRRFQNEDGTWTPLGLRERKEREGWGEQRAQKRQERAERRMARKEAKAAAIAAYNEKKRKNNPKTMTDEELRSKINRLKMEQEYRELSRNPAVKAAESLVKGYFEAKEKKQNLEKEKFQMQTKRIEAQANLAKAQAQKKEASSEFISQISGTSRKKAKADLKKVKNEERKHTIRGAISESVGNVLRKEGTRFVKEMGDSSMLMRGGRKIKAVKQRSTDYINTLAQDMAKDKEEMKKRRYRSNNPFKG